ncbi:oligopeptide/dipeptide ABC transporter ATP-binding protein [Balneatrix alpica]|uniref:Oligopeptide/dipeptide ABC transporter ATP-binding protein n=1 Tax=Balneatrix alpica TaxID=75684 RepID=A0ABV5ZBR4_9GAMM|nr:oligopeptide/dipeptide ABC transporter ATP-binding protein [Balneatrix alpica]
MSTALLEVQHLRVRFHTPDGWVTAVQDLSFRLNAGQTLGIVGESGSGKSQTAFALLGLLPPNAEVNGQAWLQGQPLLGQPRAVLNKLRAEQIGIIFQDPMTALNPYLKIGRQLAEVLVIHRGLSWQQARHQAQGMLDAVKIPAAAKRMQQYPHELSGGMRQRVMIAMALLCQPKLLIADEPTTALDVTVQAQILQLLGELQREFHTAIMLITHDLGVVAGACDEVLVLYAGQQMEYAPVEPLFYQPSHPYTQGLLQAVPKLDGPIERLTTLPGNPPNLLQLPPGCAFAPRCPQALPQCHQHPAPLQPFAERRLRACHLPASEIQEAHYA